MMHAIEGDIWICNKNTYNIVTDKVEGNFFSNVPRLPQSFMLPPCMLQNIVLQESTCCKERNNSFVQRAFRIELVRMNPNPVDANQNHSCCLLKPWDICINENIF